MKIGILSGTFNPVHSGHIALADAALEAGVDKVVWMVEPSPRHKSGYASFDDRQSMVRLAINEHANFESFAPHEQKVHSPQATHAALIEHYKQSEFSIILGGDAFTGIPYWEEIEYLKEHFSFFVGLRTEDDGEEVVELRDSLGLHVQLMNIDLPQVSSTTIRQQLADQKEVNDVPESVLEYIHEHKLYQQN